MLRYQLEFSLLALRDDPLPALHAQLTQVQASGDYSMIEEEILLKIDAENSKRNQWAVSVCFLSPSFSFSFSFFVSFPLFIIS